MSRQCNHPHTHTSCTHFFLHMLETPSFLLFSFFNFRFNSNLIIDMVTWITYNQAQQWWLISFSLAPLIVWSDVLLWICRTWWIGSKINRFLSKIKKKCAPKTCERLPTVQYKFKVFRFCKFQFQSQSQNHFALFLKLFCGC